MSWRSGDFNRAQISSVFHPFVPAHAADSLHEVDLQKLWDRGKRLLLLDVDNTLVQWRKEDFPGEILSWLEQAKALGFQICIVSNTRRVERLTRIAATLGVSTVRGRFKPSRQMFAKALDLFDRGPQEAIMIGDQLLTDVLGANRAGIEAIWVRKMDAHEFGGTRINRMMENLLRGPIYQALVTPVDETPAAPDLERAKPLAERTIIHQIVKFCVVGATSFVIDAGLTYLFVKVLPWHGGLLSDTLGNWLRGAAPGIFKYAKTPDAAATPILTGAAALVAMFNSFVWNRSWTFEVRGKEEQLGQLRRFYAVSIIGFVMNDLITSGIYNRFRHMKNALLLGKFVAAFVVAVWNFIGQRFYAFRH